MKFKSKTEAYSYVIVTLKNIQKTNKNHEIENCINEIKKFMENHEQNQEIIISSLTKLIQTNVLSSPEKQLITGLQYNLRTSNYQQSPQEKFENPLARRAESELAITLLLKPTTAMMGSVKRISDELIKFIDKQGEALEPYLKNFSEDAHLIAFGASKEEPTLQAIKALLRGNNPKKLTEIMLIHFKFAQYIIREVPINTAPTREPTGKFKNLIETVWNKESPKFFSEGLASNGKDGNEYRALVINKIYNSDLYTAISDRGRGDYFDLSRTCQLGLMLPNQTEHEENLPKHYSSWAADCKSQKPNMNSPHVIDLINNDCVYVAGPSGMTSLLLGQMEVLGNFENEDLKKHYLTAISAYIVGGGFHSFHEVLGPAEYSLKLIPGYNVRVPTPNMIAPAPNYHTFFQQQEAIDPEFNERRNKAWEKYLEYFKANCTPSLNNCELVRVLGSGRFGKVSLYKNKENGEQYAVKEFHSRHVQDGEFVSNADSEMYNFNNFIRDNQILVKPAFVDNDKFSSFAQIK